jgi:hypothetical protein
MCTLEHLKYRLGYSSRKDFLKLSGSINAESLCRQAFVLILLMMNGARVIFYMRFQPKEEAIGAKAPGHIRRSFYPRAEARCN